MLWELVEGPWLPTRGWDVVVRLVHGVQAGWGVQAEDKSAKWPRVLRGKAGVEGGLVGFLCLVGRGFYLGGHGEPLMRFLFSPGVTARGLKGQAGS